MPDRSRLPLTIPALLVGALTGTVGSLVHRAQTGPVPTGLILALVLTTAGAVGARALVGGRWGGAAAAVGWFVPVLVFATPRPEGDLLVATGTESTLWLLGGTVLQALALVRGYAPAATAPPPADR